MFLQFLWNLASQGCQEPVQGGQEPDPPQNLGGQEPVQGGQEPDPLKTWVVRNTSRVVKIVQVGQQPTQGW